MNPQTEGLDAIAGTYPFGIARGVERYRINRFLWRMTDPAHRDAFRHDPESAFEAAGLTEEECRLVRNRDWRGLIQYGAIFFVLEKLARVDGLSNAVLYAAMRGESLEAFLATRRVPAVR